MSRQETTGAVSGRTVVGTLAGLVAAIAVGLAAFATFGMQAMDHSDGAAPHASAKRALVSPREFAEIIDEPDTIAVNVHIPFEGTIPGTDLQVDYRSVASDPRLPRDTTSTIAIYCRSGNMSAIARSNLRQAGYDNVVELSGGMDAWLRSGRTLLDTAQKP